MFNMENELDVELYIPGVSLMLICKFQHLKPCACGSMWNVSTAQPAANQDCWNMSHIKEPSINWCTNWQWHSCCWYSSLFLAVTALAPVLHSQFIFGHQFTLHHMYVQSKVCYLLLILDILYKCSDELCMILQLQQHWCDWHDISFWIILTPK